MQEEVAFMFQVLVSPKYIPSQIVFTFRMCAVRLEAPFVCGLSLLLQIDGLQSIVSPIKTFHDNTDGSIIKMFLLWIEYR